ncbi:Do family serine endopeptidase [Daejeonella rubra]|nr:Do family serine endopeptidase [Daejeonella rubra]
MKNILPVIFIFCLFFQNCTGQDKKPVSEAQNDRISTFEEKQKSAGKKPGPGAVRPLISGSNFRYAASLATPGVVHIKAIFSVQPDMDIPEIFRDLFGDDFWRNYLSPDSQTPQKQMGSASGVIVSDDGYIVTNNHVVNDSESIEIVLYDQRSYPAKIIGTDPTTDLALLKIEEKDLNFIQFGNSDSLEVGDIVLAVGNPFNLASTVTAGIVSAKARNINILTDRWAVESYIQTDAAVNRGNSGGALVDISGKLVGINAAIASPNGAYAGYSFAIPIEMVKKTIDDLLKYGKVLHGYLGISISDMNGEKAKAMGVNLTTGVVVDDLEQNGAARLSGIRVKDVIIAIDEHKVDNVTQLREIIARHRPGEKVKVKFNRADKEMILEVVLKPVDEQISSVSANKILDVLGIEIENLGPSEKEKFKVRGGVIVVRINRGKIASQTRMREGFVITRVNNNAVNQSDDFIREIQSKTGGVMLEGFYPGISGTYYYAVGL